MEEEQFFTGYCRQLDASRMVEAIFENGQSTEVDCCYGACPYESQCTIAKAICEKSES